MKTAKLLMVSVLFLLFAGATTAQTYTLSGSQTKGSAGNNAKLECKAVTIQKTVKIVSISGDNNGFWITKGGGTVATYWKPNDPSAKGLMLKPGTYYIYPNLKKN